MRLSLVGVTLTLSVLAACSTTHVAPPAPAPTPAPTPAPAAAPTPAPAPHVDDAAALEAKLQQQIAALNAKSVFFDFDSFVVKSDQQSVVTDEASFMKANPASRLVVQGNTDERGGSEYNLALGQKRADAVRSALVLLGVSGDRIESTSYGKEKPRATGHDEASWSQNRRDDFVNALKK